MTPKHTVSAILALLALCVLMTGCVRKPQGMPFEDSIVVAVVPFSQALATKDLMAGYIPPESETVAAEVLSALDQDFRLRITQPVMAVEPVAQCLEDTTARLADEPHSRLGFLVAVGECAAADYVIAPQILYWKEREGSSVGVTVPAGVVIDYNVVDVLEQGLASRIHFEETQVSLAENVLTIDKFVSRYGAWVTARELAEESMEYAVKELGL